MHSIDKLFAIFNSNNIIQHFGKDKSKPYSMIIFSSPVELLLPWAGPTTPDTPYLLLTPNHRLTNKGTPLKEKRNSILTTYVEPEPLTNNPCHSAKRQNDFHTIPTETTFSIKRCAFKQLKQKIQGNNK